ELRFIEQRDDNPGVVKAISLEHRRHSCILSDPGSPALGTVGCFYESRWRGCVWPCASNVAVSPSHVNGIFSRLSGSGAIDIVNGPSMLIVVPSSVSRIVSSSLATLHSPRSVPERVKTIV